MEYFRQAIQTAPGQDVNMTPERIEEQAERLFRDFEASGQREIRQNFVTCWHANEGESEALWRLYTQANSPGVAVTTDFRSIDSALNCNFEIRFGYVQYIDFSKRFAGTYDRIFWKRASLAHEAEVRGVVRKHGWQLPDETGLLVSLELSQGIKAVVTSPFAPRWFDDVVRETIGKFGSDLRVRASSLIEEPFF